MAWAGLLSLLGGCASTPQPAEPDPYARVNLVFSETGFVDTRLDWFFPQVLSGNWMASQAWEYEGTVVGLEYQLAGTPPDIATRPEPVQPDAIDGGTVTVAIYPEGYALARHHEAPFLGTVADEIGLGHLQTDETEEFWAYQRELKNRGYNLWKLVKLQVPAFPDRTFHSQLVLKKLNSEVSEGIILTVGQARDCYVLIVIRKLVRTREDVDALGDWAYSILLELNLEAVRDCA